MKKQTRKQHFVPRCLSKYFSTPEGFIFRFDKKANKTIKTNILDLYATRDFYTIGANPIMEEFFSKEIETKSAGILEKVIRNVSLQNLNKEEIERLFAFCLVQQLRTSAMREGIETIEQKIFQKTLAILNDQGFFKDKPKEIKLEDLRIEIHPDYLKYMQASNLLNNFSDFMKAIQYNKHLYLLYAKQGTYYLGDTPVVMHQSHPCPPYGSYGYLLPYIEIYCPLSSKITLAILDKNLPLTHIHPDKSLLLMNQDHVAFLNRLQVGWSSQYIASQEEDFQTAKDFLARYPQYKTRSDGRLSID